MPGLNNLLIGTAGMEEEFKEGLEVKLGMEVEEERGSKGKEGCDGSQRSLGDLELLHPRCPYG